MPTAAATDSLAVSSHPGEAGAPSTCGTMNAASAPFSYAAVRRRYPKLC
jgi:hypothetical protein